MDKADWLLVSGWMLMIIGWLTPSLFPSKFDILMHLETFAEIILFFSTAICLSSSLFYQLGKRKGKKEEKLE